MLLSEELKKMSAESLPECVEIKYAAIVKELKDHAALGHTTCEVTFSDVEMNLVSDVSKKLREQGFTLEENPSSYRTKLTVTWG